MTRGEDGDPQRSQENAKTSLALSTLCLALGGRDMAVGLETCIALIGDVSCIPPIKCCFNFLFLFITFDSPALVLYRGLPNIFVGHKSP